MPNIGSPLTGGAYETHYASLGKGGFRSVADHTARNAILQSRCEEGMFVYTANDGKVWELQAGFHDPLIDGDWVEFTGGGGESLWSQDANDAFLTTPKNILLGAGKAFKTGTIQSPIPSGPNLFTNASFETWNGTSFCEGWGTQSTSTPDPVKSEDSDTGDYAIKLRGTGSNTCGITQTIQVSGLSFGDSYTFTFRAKRNMEDAQVYLQYVHSDEFVTKTWKRSTGEWFNGYDGEGFNITAGGDYTTFTSGATQVTIPEFDFYINIYSIDPDVLIDNCTFKKDGTGPNILTNPGFENWTEIFLPDFWDSFSDSTGTLPYLPTRSTDHHGTGSYALQFNGGGGQNYSLILKELELTPLDSYTLSFYGKGNTKQASVLYSVTDDLERTYFWNFSGDDEYTFTTTATADNQLSNPGFESWTGGEPDAWDFFNAGGGTATFADETVKTHGGSGHAVKITGDTDTLGLLTQATPFFSNDRSVECGYWGAGDSGGETGQMIILNSAGDHAWTFSGEDEGSWTSFTGSPTQYQVKASTLTTGYQYIYEYIEPYNNNGLKIYVGGGCTGGEVETIYIDDVAVNRYEGGDNPDFNTQVYVWTFSDAGAYEPYVTPDTQVVVPSISGTIQIWLVSTDVCLIDDVAFRKDGTGTNILTNGSFEVWSSPLPDDAEVSDWGSFNYPGESTETYVPYYREEDEINQGTYAIEVQPQGDGSGRVFYQLVTDLETGKSYTMTIDAKQASSSSVQAFYIFFDDLPWLAENVWDPSGQTWVAMSETDRRSAFNTDSTYAVKTSQSILCPTSQQICACFGVPKDTPTPFMYFDNATFKSNGYTSQVIFFPFQFDSTGAEDNDIVFGFYDESTDDFWFWMNADGSFDTIFDTFDFSSVPMDVADPTEDSHAVNKGYLDSQLGNSVKLLASVQVDLTTRAVTPLYTVPTGYDLVIDKILKKIGSNNVTGTTDSFNIGSNSPYYSDFCYLKNTLAVTSGIWLAIPQGGSNSWDNYLNAGFEFWSGSYPTTWDNEMFWIETATLHQESTFKHGGNYSLRLDCASNGDAVYFAQGYHYLTQGSRINTNIYAACDSGGSGNEKVGLIFANGTLVPGHSPAATQAYNFSGPNIGTYTTWTGVPTQYQVKEYTLTNSFVQYFTGDPGEVPANGHIYPFFYGIGDAGDSVYFDDATYQVTVLGTSTYDLVYPGGSVLSYYATKPITGSSCTVTIEIYGTLTPNS